jgi:hypothetical protein
VAFGSPPDFHATRGRVELIRTAHMLRKAADAQRRGDCHAVVAELFNALEAETSASTHLNSAAGSASRILRKRMGKLADVGYKLREAAL